MENVIGIVREHFPARAEVIGQFLDMFGTKRSEDGTLPFSRHPDKHFPVARIRRRLATYGWQEKRLNKEVARIAAGSDILPDRREYSVTFPYGWEKKQLTHEIRRTFPYKTGRRVLIIFDELHQFTGP